MKNDNPAHRDQIEAALSEYGDTPRPELPQYLRNPCTPYENDLALAVGLAKKIVDGTVKPCYDENGFLTSWEGFRIRGSIK